MGRDVHRYVDALKGNDWNTGYSPTEAKKTIQEGMLSTVPGTVLHICGYTKVAPARERASSGMAGWPDRPIVCQGYPEPAYVTGSDDFSGTSPNCLWKRSATDGEYYLTTDEGKAKTDTEVRVVATANVAEWNAQGMDGLRKRTKGRAGSLKSGQWVWTDADNLGFKTLYYRPAADEDIRHLHIEAGQRECPVLMDKPYNICRNIKVFLANGGEDHRVTGQNSRFE